MVLYYLFFCFYLYIFFYSHLIQCLKFFRRQEKTYLEKIAENSRLPVFCSKLYRKANLNDLSLGINNTLNDQNFSYRHKDLFLSEISTIRKYNYVDYDILNIQDMPTIISLSDKKSKS